MDPATLYIVFKVANGSDRTWQRQFPSTEECEKFVESARERSPADTVIVSYACQSPEVAPPRWIRESLVEGVPLDPKYRPAGTK